MVDVEQRVARWTTPTGHHTRVPMYSKETYKSVQESTYVSGSGGSSKMRAGRLAQQGARKRCKLLDVSQGLAGFAGQGEGWAKQAKRTSSFHEKAIATTNTTPPCDASDGESCSRTG